jgi:Uncharacterized protein conserved in bacteria (DUF2059)
VTIRRQWLAFVVFAVGLMPLAFGNGSEQLATRLLEASSMNSIYQQGFLAGYRKSTAGSNERARESACFVSKVTPQLTLQALAAGYAKEFSDQELRAALSFYESNAGKKYAQYQRVKSSEMLGVNSKEQEPELSARDLEVIGAFLETRIGKLILGTNSPMSATARTILKPQLESFRDQCSK